ncbi:MAG: hypothetical protein NVV60_11885 [Luteimonas sp.]|nr:hypothetical protein [Luteimonas sp.]
MRFAIVIFTFLLSMPTALGQDHLVSGLDSLGRQLAEFRAMPVGDPSPTPVPCPPDDLLRSYISIDRKELYLKLGEPDWVNPWTSQHWYFLTHPISSNWRGGGYCTIGFMFNNKGAVEDVAVSIAM